MAEYNVVVKTRGRSNKDQEALAKFLDEHGWKWKIQKYGPEFKTTKKVKKKKRTITVIPMERKLEFIETHISYFGMLFERVEFAVVFSGKMLEVKAIADTARLILGYSEKTSAVDIVYVLYNIYLAKYK